jgi:FkbM family methyltransferase
MTEILPGFRREHGLLWPDYDRQCAAATFSEVGELLPAILGHVRQRRVCVQAGGNCGQLVIGLAEAFGAVYTFEPDPRNFVALTVNTAHLAKVSRFQAALGSERGLRGMADGDPAFAGVNCGAGYMAGPGRIPTLGIDDLGLTACDLIVLDVEGGELSAVRSAFYTICACQPVIVIEDKGLGPQFYGEAPHAAATWLTERRGYRCAAHVGRDLVMAPC